MRKYMQSSKIASVTAQNAASCEIIVRSSFSGALSQRVARQPEKVLLSSGIIDVSYCHKNDAGIVLLTHSQRA